MRIAKNSTVTAGGRAEEGVGTTRKEACFQALAHPDHFAIITFNMTRENIMIHFDRARSLTLLCAFVWRAALIFAANKHNAACIAAQTCGSVGVCQITAGRGVNIVGETSRCDDVHTLSNKWAREWVCMSLVNMPKVGYLCRTSGVNECQFSG